MNGKPYCLEVQGMNQAVKALMTILIFAVLFNPLVEANFNMVELGPRSSGKSYIYKEITPYAILISGGQGTVAQLFVNK